MTFSAAPEPTVHPPTREQIAHAWMQHLGYTSVDIADAAARSHVVAGCEWDWNHQAWECEDENGKSNHPAYDDLVTAYAMADAVLALFPQPTPSAEAIPAHCANLYPHDAHDYNPDTLRYQKPRRCSGEGTKPPSAADMAPEPTLAVGYAFTALASWSEEDDEPDRWRKLWNGRYSLVGAAPDMDWDADCINWSTIHDVTPPKGNDRG